MVANIPAQISCVMGQCKFRFKTVSLIHLLEVQEEVGNLTRQGLINKQLYTERHFNFINNKDLLEAETIVIVPKAHPVLKTPAVRSGLAE